MEKVSKKSVNAAGRKNSFALSGICFWLVQLLLVASLSVATASEKPHFVPGRILVKTRSGVSAAKLDGKLQSHGVTSRRSLGRQNVNVVSLSEQNLDATIAALQNDPDIEFAERDYLAEAASVPNDALVGNEWHLGKIQAFQAWNGTTGSSNVIVAVLDSGVNTTHPDLASQLVPGYDFVSGSTTITDDFGHGTAVIGTVAAAGNNGIGVAGVAYGCRILPVKVMDASGFAAYSTIAQGIHYAVDNGARVINLSVAGSASSQTMQDAINYAWSNNVIVVAAAGNNSSSTPQYPAACAHVVGVSATASDDTLTWFSSFGSYVSLSAPGDVIWTTQRDAVNAPYGSWRGTSFASPVVAAVAALVISANPALSGDQVVSVLEQNADDLGTPGYDTFFGYGRVNAFRAVSAACALPGAVIAAPVGTPTVVIATPTQSQQFNFGTNISLAASASPSTANGTVTSVTLYANGSLIASGSGTSFNSNWTPAQPGNYSLVAIATDDRGLNATSSPVAVSVVSVETIPPTVTVTSAPKNGAQLFSPTVLLAGTASDNVAVDHVEITLNNSVVMDANGTTSWAAQIALQPGVNTLQVRSVDTSGNVSPTVTLTYTYVVIAPVVMQTNGWGNISPNLNGSQLQVGKTYTVRAVPGPGQAFAGWNGLNGSLSYGTALTFVMQSNLVLTANFVPSPFPAVKGNYAGLAANTNGVTPDTSGYFNLNVTPVGAFSGKLQIGNGRFGFRGQFNINGDTTVTVNRGQLATPLQLTLHIDLTNGTDQITGALTDGAWVAAVNGDRNVFNSQLNPAQQAGLRNFILQRADNTSVEAGVGAGKISTGGTANVVGALDNGIKFHTSSMLAKNGDCPFYLSLNNGTEIVIGWLNFPKVPNPTASGTVLWVSTGTNSFAAQLQAASMP